MHNAGEQDDDDPAISEGLVATVTQALTLPVDDLLEALKAGGLPSTVEEL